ncbi:MAG: DoxX family protein [Actinomycetota bacterium]|nr:DoxX family protein [Actinomycetota bacterium]
MPKASEQPEHPRRTAALAALFATSGTLHFLRPRPFEQIVPRRLPRKRALVYASGAAELICAAGLLHPRTRGLAGATSAALLLAVFPANVQMAADAQRSPSTAYRVGTLARLPLQWPMIRTAWRAARH